MKKYSKAILWVLIGLVVFFAVVAIPALGRIAISGEDLSAAALFAQTTPTPVLEDVSEIGSTDGIIMVGVFIVLIVVMPVVLSKKSWSDT